MVNIVSYARIEIPSMFGIEQSKKDDITTVSYTFYKFFLLLLIEMVQNKRRMATFLLF